MDVSYDRDARRPSGRASLGIASSGRSRATWSYRRSSAVALAFVGLAAGCSPDSSRREDGAALPPARESSSGDAAGKSVAGGRLRVVNGCRVLELSGSPDDTQGDLASIGDQDPIEHGPAYFASRTKSASPYSTG